MKKFVLSNLLAFTLALGAVALAVPASADAPLVSITGTVVSLDGEVLVLKTDKGNLTFDLDKSTVMPTNTIAVGNRITVTYDSDDKTTDKMDARQIVMAPEASPVTPTPTATPAPTPVSQPEPQPTAVQQEESTELPETASPLPLVGGAGILALAAALLLRKRVR